MKLNTPGIVTDSHRLATAGFRTGQHAGTFRRCLNLDRMPLKTLNMRFDTCKQRICTSIGRKLNLKNPDLRLSLQGTDTTQCIGQQLVTKTKSKVGFFQVADPMADSCLFRHQPWTFVFFPDIHRTTHNPKRVIRSKIWDPLSCIEFDCIPLNFGLVQ